MAGNELYQTESWQLKPERRNARNTLLVLVVNCCFFCWVYLF